MRWHMYIFWNDGTSLYHYGVSGQKWGLRKYQEYDGSLTDEGYRHYGYGRGETRRGPHADIPLTRTGSYAVRSTRRTGDSAINLNRSSGSRDIVKERQIQDIKTRKVSSERNLKKLLDNSPSAVSKSMRSVSEGLRNPASSGGAGGGTSKPKDVSKVDPNLVDSTLAKNFAEDPDSIGAYVTKFYNTNILQKDNENVISNGPVQVQRKTMKVGSDTVNRVLSKIGNNTTGSVISKPKKKISQTTKD